ncbi:Clp protease N-terminal domain-containing protein [Streptomyces sp. NPDC056696]|uniref:Clp protease N-terminal domain-containing protein n=1 Tax=Streptomyces sp. NPDC056696 TaxID=3345914 RepID=UPI00367FB511
MMFERFSPDARTVVVHTQEHARRLGHNHVGPEHLLLALVSLDQPASAALREHGVTPEGVEEQIVRLVGLGAGSHLFGTLDRDALASVGIDIDAVRARIEESFGPEPSRAPTSPSTAGAARPGAARVAQRPRPSPATGADGAPPDAPSSRRRPPPPPACTEPPTLAPAGTSGSPLAPRKASRTPSTRHRPGTTVTSASSTSASASSP